MLRKEVGVKNKQREHKVLTMYSIKREEQAEYFHVQHQSALIKFRISGVCHLVFVYK